MKAEQSSKQLDLRKRISKRNIFLLSIILATVAFIVFIIILDQSITPEERIKKQNDEYWALTNSGKCKTAEEVSLSHGKGLSPFYNTPQEDIQKCLQAFKYLDEHLYGHDKMITGTMECITPEIVLEDEFDRTSFSQGLEYKFVQFVDDSNSHIYITDDSGDISRMKGLDVSEHFKIIEKHVTLNVNME